MQHGHGSAVPRSPQAGGTGHRLLRLVHQGSLQQCDLFLDGVPISRQQLQQELPHQDLQVLEQNVRPAMWAVGRSSSSAGDSSDEVQALLQLCSTTQAVVQELHSLQQRMCTATPAEHQAAQDQMVYHLVRLEHLLTGAADSYAATPFLVYACVAHSRLTAALLQLLHHKTLPQLLQQEQLVYQALCVVEAMALSDLRQLLLRPSRYSNEEVSLVQALGAACQSAAQLLPALHQQHMEQQAQLGAAAGSSSMDTDEDGVQQQQQQQLEACCRLAGALEHCWLQVQASFTEAAAAGKKQPDAAAGTPGRLSQQAAQAGQGAGTSSSAAPGQLPGGYAEHLSEQLRARTGKRPASTDLEEVTAAMGRAGPRLSSGNGRSTPDWQEQAAGDGLRPEDVAEGPSRPTPAVPEAAAAGSHMGTPQGVHETPSGRQGCPRRLDAAVMESARRLSMSLRVSQPSSPIAAAASPSAAPAVAAGGFRHSPISTPPPAGGRVAGLGATPGGGNGPACLAWMSLAQGLADSSIEGSPAPTTLVWGSPEAGRAPTSPAFSTWGSPSSLAPTESGSPGPGPMAGAPGGMSGSGLGSMPLANALSARLAALHPLGGGGGGGSPLRFNTYSAISPQRDPGAYQRDFPAAGAAAAAAAGGAGSSTGGLHQGSGMRLDSSAFGAVAALPPTEVQAQQPSVIQVTLYDRAGSVSLLDPGHLRPDSPMRMEVPHPTPGLARNVPPSVAAAAPSAMEAAAFLTGPALGLAPISTPSNATGATEAAAAAASAGTQGVDAAQGAAAGGAATSAAGASGAGDSRAGGTAAAPTTLGGDAAMSAPAASAGGPLGAVRAAAAAAAAAAASGAESDSQPGTPASLVDTAPQPDCRRSRRRRGRGVQAASRFARPQPQLDSDIRPPPGRELDTSGGDDVDSDELPALTSSSGSEAEDDDMGAATSSSSSGGDGLIDVDADMLEGEMEQQRQAPQQAQQQQQLAQPMRWLVGPAAAASTAAAAVSAPSAGMQQARGGSSNTQPVQQREGGPDASAGAGTAADTQQGALCDADVGVQQRSAPAGGAWSAGAGNLLQQMMWPARTALALFGDATSDSCAGPPRRLSAAALWAASGGSWQPQQVQGGSTLTSLNLQAWREQEQLQQQVAQWQQGSGHMVDMQSLADAAAAASLGEPAEQAGQQQRQPSHLSQQQQQQQQRPPPVQVSNLSLRASWDSSDMGSPDRMCSREQTSGVCGSPPVVPLHQQPQPQQQQVDAGDADMEVASPQVQAAIGIDSATAAGWVGAGGTVECGAGRAGAWGTGTHSSPVAIRRHLGGAGLGGAAGGTATPLSSSWGSGTGGSPGPFQRRWADHVAAAASSGGLGGGGSSAAWGSQCGDQGVGGEGEGEGEEPALAPLLVASLQAGGGVAGSPIAYRMLATGAGGSPRGSSGTGLEGPGAGEAGSPGRRGGTPAASGGADQDRDARGSRNVVTPTNAPRPRHRLATQAPAEGPAGGPQLLGWGSGSTAAAAAAAGTGGAVCGEVGVLLEEDEVGMCTLLVSASEVVAGGEEGGGTWGQARQPGGAGGVLEDMDFELDVLDQAANTRMVELVGPVCPLQVVTSRYAAHNQLLAARLASLEVGWPSCRLVAGDGNCFFRGYLFGMLEALLAHADLALHHRLAQHLAVLWDLLQGHYPAMEEAAATGYCLLQDFLQRAWYHFDEHAAAAGEAAAATTAGSRAGRFPGEGPIYLPELEAALSQRAVFDPLVKFARLATSWELQVRQEVYAPFLPGCGDMYAGLSIPQLCSMYVERMGQEVEQLQVVALANVLRVTVGVLDVAGSSINYVQHPAGEAPPLFWLLHLPGHFNIIQPQPQLDVLSLLMQGHAPTQE